MENYNLLLWVLLILSTAANAQQLSKLDYTLMQVHPKNIFPEGADKSYLFKSKQKGVKQDTFIATTKSARTTFMAEVFTPYPVLPTEDWHKRNIHKIMTLKSVRIVL